VFDVYAQRTLRDIEENGYYVRVAAGKEFYVYVLETVNPDKAKVAGVLANTPSNVHENATHSAETSSADAVQVTGTKG
jgi:hypothetical protein